MSTCVSRLGEYSEHVREENSYCGRCGQLVEEWISDRDHPQMAGTETLDALRPGAVVVAYGTPYIKLSRDAGLWQSIDGIEHAGGLFLDGPVYLVWRADA